MFNRIQAVFEFLPRGLTAEQHYRNLALIGSVLLIVIGLIAGWSVVFSILSVVIGGFAALLAFDWLRSQPASNGMLRQTTERIRIGAQLFLFDLYKSITFLSLLIALLIGVLMNWSTAVGFLFGVLLSELIGYLGFNITISSRSISLQATSRNLISATQLALSSGVISGLLVSGAALLGLAMYYTILIANQTQHLVEILAGLAAGAALVSLLVSVSGTIFARSSIASWQNPTSQLKVDNIPIQPANLIHAIAEQVNLSTGVITDLFATIVIALVASIIVNSQYGMIENLTAYPLLIVSVSIISVLLVLQFLQRMNATLKSDKLLKYLYLASVTINALLLMPITWLVFDQSQLSDHASLSIGDLYQSVVIGLLLALLISVLSCYKNKLNRNAPNSSFLTQYSAIVMYAIVLVCLYVSYRMADLIGIEVSIISMLSLSAMIVAVSCFSQLINPEQSLSTDPQQLIQQQQLVSDANAVTYTFGLVASALTALVLAIASVMQLSGNEPFSLINLQFLIGILFGVVGIFWYSALLIKVISQVTSNSQSISSSHYAIIGLAKRCKRELLIPILIPISIALLISVVFSQKLVSGIVIGIGFGGLCVGLTAMAGGYAWVYIKRYFVYFWSASNAPKGWDDAVSEDWVNDPYRKAIVSSLNPMIKMVAILALLMAV